MSLNLTVSGHKLLLRAMAGEASIEFTRIQLGNGADAGENVTHLSNPLLTLGISKYEISDIFLILSAVFNNADVEVGFRATETGVFVQDPENPDQHILYAYEYVSEEIADRIHSSKDRIVETQFDVVVYIGDAENVTASISLPNAYVTEEAFLFYCNRRDNPHDVTAAQVGLGNVPNVTPENQQPVFSESLTEFSVSESGVVSFSNIRSKEKMGSILQKIRSSIAQLISHLNAKNPHRITSSDIDAAEKIHTHSANDITQGVLGSQRGGTGGKTFAEARVNLGIQSGTVLIDTVAGQCAVYGPIFFEKSFDYIPKVVVTHNSRVSDSLDIRVSVRGTTKESFYVCVLSETADQQISMNWVAIQ